MGAKMKFDFSVNEDTELPLEVRPSISLLLGAGFSAPMGYPVGNTINEKLRSFDDHNLDFSPSGELSISTDGQKPVFQMFGVLNAHQKYFIFCKRLIKEYTVNHNNQFDYEQFYDFIMSNEAKQKCYQVLCDDILGNHERYDNYLFNVSHIYNQMTAHLLKDKNGKTWYDDEPFKINGVGGYDGFLNYLSQISQKYIVNVHTLNHDLLFDSFNRTGYINGNMTDGFDEYGSEYYGELRQGSRIYHCRLERYTGRYNSPIRLYKLHGSLDYVPYYRQTSMGTKVPEKYVKIKWGMGAGNILKSRKSKKGYDSYPFECHADFLTGTTSKIQRYQEPLLFRKLFTAFKKNLRNAEQLIIIGYGCKDTGINEMIKENFDYEHKPSFIIDAYAKEGGQVELFQKEINAKLLRIQIDDIKSESFM